MLYLQATGFVKQDRDIMEFFNLPITSQAKFMDFSNTNWKSASTKKNGISAVSSALDTHAIKSRLPPKQYAAIKEKLKQYMNEVTNVQVDGGTINNTLEEVHLEQVQDTIDNHEQEALETQNEPEIIIPDNEIIQDEDAAGIESDSDFEVDEAINVVHKEVKQQSHTLSKMFELMTCNHARNTTLQKQVLELQQKCAKLEEENKMYAKQLAVASNSNTAINLITSLQYSIEMLLTLYKHACPSKQSYEDFETIVRSQIDQQWTFYRELSAAKPPSKASKSSS